MAVMAIVLVCCDPDCDNCHDVLACGRSDMNPQTLGTLATATVPDTAGDSKINVSKWRQRQHVSRNEVTRTTTTTATEGATWWL